MAPCWSTGTTPARSPRLLVAVTQEITDGHDPARTVAKRFGYAERRTATAPRSARRARRRTSTTTHPMIPNGRVRCASAKRPGCPTGVENVALDWAVTEGMPAELAAHARPGHQPGSRRSGAW